MPKPWYRASYQRGIEPPIDDGVFRDRYEAVRAGATRVRGWARIDGDDIDIPAVYRALAEMGAYSYIRETDPPTRFTVRVESVGEQT